MIRREFGKGIRYAEMSESVARCRLIDGIAGRFATARLASGFVNRASDEYAAKPC